jgi:hypothetical protein
LISQRQPEIVKQNRLIEWNNPFPPNSHSFRQLTSVCF